MEAFVEAEEEPYFIVGMGDPLNGMHFMKLPFEDARTFTEATRTAFEKIDAERLAREEKVLNG